MRESKDTVGLEDPWERTLSSFKIPVTRKLQQFCTFVNKPESSDVSLVMSIKIFIFGNFTSIRRNTKPETISPRDSLSIECINQSGTHSRNLTLRTTLSTMGVLPQDIPYPPPVLLNHLWHDVVARLDGGSGVIVCVVVHWSTLSESLWSGV